MFLDYDDISAKVDMQKLLAWYNMYPARRANSVIYYLCPFHREKTASLTLWITSNSCSCLGCGVGFANPIWFAARMENLSFHDTANLLIRMFNLQLSNMKDEYQTANERYSLHFNIWRMSTRVDTGGDVRMLKQKDVAELKKWLSDIGFSNAKLKHMNLGRIVGKYIIRVGGENQITDFIAYDEAQDKSYSVYYKPYDEAAKEIAEKYLKGAVNKNGETNKTSKTGNNI